jgi:regulation of enolase protein 1 (concanavalin A-like superfamily)
MTDVGGALKGGLSGNSNNFELFGGGKDIWAKRDEFRFLHQTLSGDGTIEVTVNSVELIDTYTKSGIMLRDGLSPDAKFLLVSIFPNGEINVAKREKAGEDVIGGETKSSTFPGITLKITRKNGTLKVETKRNGDFTTIATLNDFLPSVIEAGVVALSHSGHELAKIQYSNLKLSKENN